ncbi:MAG: oxidoreductase [Betaproteobacteria bacterium]|jgi:acrylyl-CoA reductase (NADPH)|nr:oxidoreductase [Betaproteobacteria bacterium]
MSFRALFLEKSESGFHAGLRELADTDLATHAADGNVTVRIAWSTVNYKDGLALTNRSPVVRKWPMVPGIDGAGVVEASDDPRFAPGDTVVLNGWGVGETHWGCLAGKARLKGDWLIALPAGLDAHGAMAIGTAGYTAMLAALALEQGGVRPGDGEVLVTGAAGGVGSVAIAILAGWGHRVVASTGRIDETDYLTALGAAEVIDRAALSAPGKPLQKERWAGVIDAVGSHTLANACAQTRSRGVVAACGLAQGMDFPSTVAPFILRGVTLAGIDSVMCPRALREAAWQRLASDLERSRLAAITRDIGLADAIDAAPEVLAGRVRGRLVVDVSR